MTANDKPEPGKTPPIRDLQKDEIDNVSGGAGTANPPGWVDPEPQPWIDPEPEPVRPTKSPAR